MSQFVQNAGLIQVENKLIKGIKGKQIISWSLHGQSFSEITGRALVLDDDDISWSVVSVSDLLGLKPAPNNGTYGSLNEMLKEPQFLPSMPQEVTPPSPASDSEVTVTHDLGCSCDDEVSGLFLTWREAELHQLCDVAKSQKKNHQNNQTRILFWFFCCRTKWRRSLRLSVLHPTEPTVTVGFFYTSSSALWQQSLL